LIPTASYVNATPDTTNINQTISQIANQIATANPGLDTNKVSQTLEQVASQTASGGEGAGDVNQIISQIANQVAANPKGPIAHILYNKPNKKQYLLYRDQLINKSPSLLNS
jgi:hypothetical protein